MDLPPVVGKTQAHWVPVYDSIYKYDLYTADATLTVFKCTLLVPLFKTNHGNIVNYL